MAKKRTLYIHVIPRKDSWVVRGESKRKVISVHETQREAIDAGRIMAQSIQGELVIHAREGRIRERESYGSDPFPQKKSPRIVLFPIARSKTSAQRIEKAIGEVIEETQVRTLDESREDLTK
jgi:Uncharacterized protein conserved in bacteria (DUF2188)